MSGACCGVVNFVPFICLFDNRYRSEIWLGGAIFETVKDKEAAVEAQREVQVKRQSPDPAAKKGDAVTLELCLDAVRKQLEDKWELALSTKDVQIRKKLEDDAPPSSAELKQFWKTRE